MEWLIINFLFNFLEFKKVRDNPWKNWVVVRLVSRESLSRIDTWKNGKRVWTSNLLTILPRKLVRDTRRWLEIEKKKKKKKVLPPVNTSKRELSLFILLAIDRCENKDNWESYNRKSILHFRLDSRHVRIWWLRERCLFPLISDLSQPASNNSLYRVL